jgi:hypothetical protein
VRARRLDPEAHQEWREIDHGVNPAQRVHDRAPAKMKVGSMGVCVSVMGGSNCAAEVRCISL